jgi:O-antigen/teichoic acid export membrane protein
MDSRDGKAASAGTGGKASLLRVIARTHVPALADQAVVSGTSFAATVMIGRWTHAGELGVYAIAISVLVSALAIQEALVSIPYAIQRYQPVGTSTEHSGSSLAQSGVLSVLGTAFLVAAASGLSACNAAPELVTVTWVLAGVMPLVLLREFARRFAFAHLRFAQILLLDVAVAAIQLGMLVWLVWTGRASAAAACAALGTACGLSAAVWLWLARAKFAIRVSGVWASVRHSWGLGQWFLASQILAQVQIYLPCWLTVLIAGAGATGIYAACMSVVALANPLILGLGNTLIPRSVLAWNEMGAAHLRRQAIQDALLLGAVTTLFCVLMLFAGDDVLGWLYGTQYEGHGATVTMLALAILAAALGIPPANALASMQQPRAIVWTCGIGAAVTAVLVPWLMVHWGLWGAAGGALAGNTAATAARWVVLLAFVPRTAQPPSGRIGETQTRSDSEWAAIRTS